MMEIDTMIESARELIKPFRVTDRQSFRLKYFDPADTLDFKSEDKPRVKENLVAGVQALAKFQEILYAQNRWGVLGIFQAMDTAGKDSAIKHVMSGVNPQGCQVHSFKAPSSEELDHDYLWRCARRLPERGMIGLFNRSYYEETLIVRVHPELLEKQKLPPELVTKNIWKERFQEIRKFERYLTRNGIAVRKFFLHLSKKEQKKRFFERIDKPEKHWKFSANDVHEREHWQDYMEAYEDAIRHTATEEAPWYIVPANNKWFTHLIVAAALVDLLGSLDLRYPKLSKDGIKELARTKEALSSGK
jgi:PPK2 family polyphosphate:nucleotide phosphotransferase